MGQCFVQLEKVPYSEIQNVIRISYDRLDCEEKNIFLDIACFFKGQDLDDVAKILDGCYSSTLFKISTLVDKCLITICNNKSEMHDLLQEMGRSIVHEESISDPGKRSKLWNPENIYHVLTRNKGTEAIDGISVDTSRAREMSLEADIFDKMYNVRVLKFWHIQEYGWPVSCHEDTVKLPHSLTSLPDELTYLHWNRFPLKSFPSKFCGENMVELRLPCVEEMSKKCRRKEEVFNLHANHVTT